MWRSMENRFRRTSFAYSDYFICYRSGVPREVFVAGYPGERYQSGVMTRRESSEEAG